MPRLGYWFSEAPAARLYHGVPPAPLVWHKTSLLLAFGESGRFVRGTGNSQSACALWAIRGPGAGGLVSFGRHLVQLGAAISLWVVRRRPPRYDTKRRNRCS